MPSKKNNKNFEPFESFRSFLTMEIRERITKKAKELFFRYGIKSITMDDIAKELGISKKTIYQHFKDKDEIVFEVTSQSFECDKQDIEKLYQETSNPIEEIVQSTVYMREMFSSINPALFFDLKKYHPRSWEQYVAHKNGFFIDVVKRNLTEGIKTGCYRAEINIDILAKLRIEEVELGFNDEVYPHKKYSLLEVQVQLMNHFLRGILTPKGLETYEKLLININK